MYVYTKTNREFIDLLDLWKSKIKIKQAKPKTKLVQALNC